MLVSGGMSHLQDSDAAVVGHLGDAAEAAALVAHVAVLRLVAALLDLHPNVADLLRAPLCLEHRQLLARLALRRPRVHRPGRPPQVAAARRPPLPPPRRRGAGRAAAAAGEGGARARRFGHRGDGVGVESAVLVEDVVAVDHIDQKVGGVLRVVFDEAEARKVVDGELRVSVVRGEAAAPEEQHLVELLVDLDARLVDYRHDSEAAAGERPQHRHHEE